MQALRHLLYIHCKPSSVVKHVRHCRVQKLSFSLATQHQVVVHSHLVSLMLPRYSMLALPSSRSPSGTVVVFVYKSWSALSAYYNLALESVSRYQ